MAKKAFKPWPAKFNAAVLMGLLVPCGSRDWRGKGMVRSPSDRHSRAGASRRSMMGLACPKMGLAGQGSGFAGRPSWPAGRSTSGIPFENHANFDRAALGEIVAVVICLIAIRTQQYRCRGGRDASSASDPDVGWLIRNALTFSVDAWVVVGLAANGVMRVQISLTSGIVSGLRPAGTSRRLRLSLPAAANPVVVDSRPKTRGDSNS
jgi:hypothetical protein